MQMQSDQLDQIFAALSKAQGQMKAAIKDSKNPYFKSNYADLNSVFEACRNQLSENGLCVSQTMFFQEGQNYLITTLGHTSGQWIKSMAPIISAKPDAQSFGSAVTYMRRYSLSSICGISTDEDDDGNKAVGKREEKSEPVEIITKAQAEELRLLKATANKEASHNVDKMLVEKKLTLATLPVTGYSYIKDLLLKNQSQDMTKGLQDGQ